MQCNSHVFPTPPWAYLSGFPPPPTLKAVSVCFDLPSPLFRIIADTRGVNVPQGCLAQLAPGPGENCPWAFLAESGPGDRHGARSSNPNISIMPCAWSGSNLQPQRMHKKNKILHSTLPLTPLQENVWPIRKEKNLIFSKRGKQLYPVFIFRLGATRGKPGKKTWPKLGVFVLLLFSVGRLTVHGSRLIAVTSRRLSGNELPISDLDPFSQPPPLPRPRL